MDYYRWRLEDAHRNALNAHCYWTLQKEGVSPADSAATFAGMSVAGKNEFLFQKGVNFEFYNQNDESQAGRYSG